MQTGKLNSKELEEKYPKGTKLRLTDPINDEYTPKDVGDIFTVSFADDNMQLHGSWSSGGSMALIVGVDSFEVIE